MSHQAGLYLTPADTKALEAQLRKRFNFVIFRFRSKSPKPHTVDSLYIEEGGNRVFDYYVARTADLNAIVMDYVQTQGYWTAEIMQSPMVEMRGSSLRDNVFYRGRVYYNDGYYAPDGQWVLKSEEFRKWAKALLSAVKRALRPVKPFPTSTYYAGEEAAAILASGTVKLAP